MSMGLDSSLKFQMTNSYILHIETATKVCSVAVSLNGKLLSFKETQADGFIHSEALTGFIQEALNASGILISDLNAVSFSSGPGSYTGLRIGLSTAKGICFALKIPLISVATLDALFSLVPKSDKNIIPMLDARRMEVYAAVYNSNGEVIQALDAIVLDETSFSSFEPFTILGDGLEKCKELWAHRPIEWREDLFTSARGQVSIAYQKFQENKFEDLAYFTPIYLKDANGVRR